MKAKFFLLTLVFLAAFKSEAQSPLPADGDMFTAYNRATWNETSVHRLGDIAKLWGVIKYFHPEILKGAIDPDKLILDNIGPILDDPSGKNFETTVNRMLSSLKDPESKILRDRPSDVYKFLPLKTHQNKDASYLALPQKLFDKGRNIDFIFSSEALHNRTVIIDLRNAESNDDLGLKQYQHLVQPLIAAMVDKILILPTLKSVYYHAMLRQDFPDDLDVIPSAERKNDPNFWYQERFGFKNVSQGAFVLPKPDMLFKNKRFCFIVNQFDNANTLKALLALRNRNKCNLIFDGPIPDYLLGDFYDMSLSDGLKVKVKVAEQVYEDGTSGSGADLYIKHLDEKSILRINKLLMRSPIKPLPKKLLNNTVVRLPQQAYGGKLYPEAKLRLLGLFNFWNVINYFSPNKKLISGSWDDALNYFIPRFLFARDYKGYYWQLRELLSKLNDGHSEITLNWNFVPPKGINDFYTPFCVKHVEGKTVVVKLVKDSAAVIAQQEIKVGDVITAIDGVPVTRLYHSWAKFIDSTNDDNYYRVLHKVQLVSRAGPEAFHITILRNDKEKEVVVKPVSSASYFKEFYQVYYPPIAKPYWKAINDSVGYIRVNSIVSKQVDSAWQSLKQVKYIILDARGYPKDDDIVKTIAAPFINRTDTVCINAFPEITYPLASRNAVTLEPETVMPIPYSTDMSNVKKFIVLCGAGNGSQAETNIISWQKILHPVTIGTKTVGANGVSNSVLLPGGYVGHYSGFSVYYPDGTPNQELGVKIDILANITIKGELAGKDEILDRAIQYIYNKEDSH
jgi:C-terminal processing protease CtpA/Prc